MADRTFHWADYLVFALSLAMSAGIGIFFAIRGRLKETTEEFLVGKRELHWLPVSLSLMASTVNAVFIIGIPAEIYYQGGIFALAGTGLLLVTPIIAHVFVPVYHNMKITSAYEYLENRFNVAVRMAASLTFSLSIIIFLAVVLYVPAFAFSRVTGLSLVATILATGFICTLYTGLGGIKAVIWTDTLQMIIMLIGLLLLASIGASRAGSTSAIWNKVHSTGRLNFNKWSPHPHERHTVWTQMIGQGVIWMSVFCSNQMMIQRFFAIKKLRDAQLCMYMSSAFSNIILLLIMVVALVMYAFYSDCDPMFMGPGKGINRGDEIVPYFLMDILGHLHGLPGLFCASVFAAALSSVSSALNSLSAVLLEDLIKPAYHMYTKGKTLTDRKCTFITKGIAVGFGLLTVGLSFAADKMGPVLVQIPPTIWGAVNGPMFGLFILAFFFPCANGWGALTGLLTSLVFNLWLAIGGVLYKAPLKAGLPLGTNCPNFTLPPPPKPHIPSSLADFYEVSYNWYGMYGVLVCVIVGLITSVIIMLATKKTGADTEMMYPFEKKCFCCCPSGFLRFWRGEWFDTQKVEPMTKELTVTSDVEKSQELGQTNPTFTDSQLQIDTKPTEEIKANSDESSNL